MTPVIDRGPVERLPPAENAEAQQSSRKTIVLWLASDATTYLGGQRLDRPGELVPRLRERLEERPESSRLVPECGRDAPLLESPERDGSVPAGRSRGARPAETATVDHGRPSIRCRVETRPRGAAVLADINITPLIDVMLVLLVIFMIVTPLATRGPRRGPAGAVDRVGTDAAPPTARAYPRRVRNEPQPAARRDAGRAGRAPWGDFRGAHRPNAPRPRRRPAPLRRGAWRSWTSPAEPARTASGSSWSGLPARPIRADRAASLHRGPSAALACI